MKDLKYLIAYLVPASALLGLAWQGLWSWLTVALVFGILPIIELFTPESSKNIPESLEESRSRRIFFDWLLYANAPLLFGIVGWYLWTVSGQSLSVSEVLGLTLGAGIMAGAGGINVAHELGHRARKGEQLLAQTVGTIAAPLSGFVRVLNGNLSGLVYALKAVQEKKSA